MAYGNGMKQTYDTLRTWYLKDLEGPDIHHGRASPKARRLDHWKKITSAFLGGPGNISSNGDTWVWSDIHWGHKNIIKYADGARPFESVEHMNQALIDNYLAVVKDGDIVIFGGDISFMGVPATNDILHLLPGYKIQIVGNHDIDRKGEPMKMHFNERHLCMVRDIEAYGISEQLLITHYPLDRVPPNCYNLHGHIHQNLANDWNINMCVEHTGCAPMNMKKVAEIIKQRNAAKYTIRS